ncbi:mycofactocin biosynthesis peptidyl-dipeptidase MftE [Streptomyces sp. NBC_00582]|uniref:mycofactocin biosynthesis peptidyl-dipeptidase MftE n=1 Tax=Streptomyces sp. NBC_00582 TaxID=2975783 RepID=UPI00106422DA|nr:mycofactocin biosynthesis peptidyl-dipeptidase MftE [Streptomyces sp. NBC_00582]WUB59217.1 mycofactocin biosynthesis peptidyl-dipeptidase MftE [Streptomyces sp. NBC_00582]
MTRPLGERAWTEVEAGGSLLIVPLGAVEQHGPHLPLDTDVRIALAVATRAAAALPGAVVAPPLAYGASGEHAGFAGTLSIGAEVLELLLVELGRSARDTFRRVLFVSGHGGNAWALARALRRLRGEGLDAAGWVPVVRDGDAHAGRTETSLLLHIAPHLVRAGEAAPGDCRPIRTLLPVLRAKGVRGVSANGVLGDPTGATAAEGARLLDDFVDRLVGKVRP